MDPLTLYRFEITADVKDKSGRAFLPFSSVFTTSSGTGGGTANVAFDRTDSRRPSWASPTPRVVIGPDGKLYAGSIYGQIYRWTINADGTLANQETINTVRTHATANGWEGAPNRTIIGLAFDPASTATNPILWITDNYAYLGPGRAGRHRRHRQADRPEPGELPGDRGQPAALDQGPRDQLHRVPGRQAATSPRVR